MEIRKIPPRPTDLPRLHEERYRTWKEAAQKKPGKWEEYLTFLIIYLPDLFDALGENADARRIYATAEKRAMERTDQCGFYSIPPEDDEKPPF